jgi:RimJ/RimL family protein N-acetyltransferase
MGRHRQASAGMGGQGVTSSIPVIIGPRVVLRGLEPRDIPDIRGHSEELWQRLSADSNPHHWVIEAGGRFVGTARLYPAREPHRRARYAVGIVSPPHIGHGLGTEATRLVLAYAFEVLRLHRVEARVPAGNQRGLACLHACGFAVEGRERESALIDGEWHDEVVLGILEQEYRRLSGAWPKLAAVGRGPGPDAGSPASATAPGVREDL